MMFPLPEFHPKPVAEPPAMVRVATREDVLWNRPVFKAPPLKLHPQPFDATIGTDDFPGAGFGHR